MNKLDLRPFRNIDAILTIGGGKRYPAISKNGNPVLLDKQPVYECPRSKAALELYKKLYKKRTSPLVHILTGRCSGLEQTPVEEHDSEAITMGLYLLAHDIPEENILLETEAQDTIANFVYSMPLIKQINAKNLAIVVDEFTADRVLKTGKRILGDKYTLVPYTTEEDRGNKITELAVTVSQFFDLNLLNKPEPENEQQWQQYMQQIHPFHADNPTFSFYGLGIKIFRALQHRPENYKRD